MKTGQNGVKSGCEMGGTWQNADGVGVWRAQMGQAYRGHRPVGGRSLKERRCVGYLCEEGGIGAGGRPVNDEGPPQIGTGQTIRAAKRVPPG